MPDKPPLTPAPETLLDRGTGGSPEIRAPLAPFAGARPPAPAWFETAIAAKPERSLLATPRGRIEMLTWGERGRGGLLFVHGSRAHADWWSFIAPLFAEDHRVAALSLAGMGGSEWRDRYDAASFGEDLEAVAQAAGLYESGEAPVYVGHSFGGGVVFHAAATHSERMRAAILVDVGFGKPDAEAIIAERARLARHRDERPDHVGPRVYPTLSEALAHFRLAPPQPLENLFIVDHIARGALKPAPRPEGSGEGWTWKFDPNIWEKLDGAVMQELLASRPRVEVPLAHVFGELSPFRPANGAATGPIPADTLLVGVPQADHHVPIDQPLALVAAIRALLAAWRA